MPTELCDFIQEATVVDTHEHMVKESEWVENGPRDVLEDLFSNYVTADLISAGASPGAVGHLRDGADPDVEGRWSAVENAWHLIRHTGYGESVAMIARHIYGIDEIGPDAVRRSQPKLEADTGVTVKDLATLEQAMEAVFEKHGPRAIAVKTQHAYNRTLRWEKRSKADAERAFAAILANAEVDEGARLCFGDWCLARGAELAHRYDLPLKIHTGYYAGNNTMQVDRIRAGHLCPLLMAYPDTRFVLMHIAWPYCEEVIAMAKHFTNAWADLCWAWSINPAASARFVRQFIHAAPAGKLFAFGGDTDWPTTAYAYSLQMRRHLTRALEAEIEAGEMTEPEAIAFARRVLFENQMNCFDVGGTRAANRQASVAV